MEGESLHFYGTPAHLEGESMHFYGTPAHLEGESVHFYGTPAHLEGESLLLNQLGDQAKTAPGAPETKRAPF